MGGVTNDLIKKSKQISKNFSESEYDVLVSSGEQMACSLIAGRLCDLGYNSKSMMGWQVPILTEGKYSSARIVGVNKKKINSLLKKGITPVVAGFQGINIENRINTLGRGAVSYTNLTLPTIYSV